MKTVLHEGGIIQIYPENKRDTAFLESIVGTHTEAFNVEVERYIVQDTTELAYVQIKRGETRQ